MHLKIPGNTKTCSQSRGSTLALKQVKPGFELTSLIPGGHPNQRVLAGMESTTSYSGIPVKEMQQNNNHRIVSGKQSPQKTCPIFVKILCHTGELRREVLKTLVTSENTEYEKCF